MMINDLDYAFGMYEETNLVELWMTHYTIWTFFIDTAENTHHFAIFLSLTQLVFDAARDKYSKSFQKYEHIFN